MKYLIKKIYLVLFLVIFLPFSTESFASDNREVYSKNDISNYFSGIISAEQALNNNSFRFLNKAQSLKNKHTNFNVQFIRAMILLEKFKQAFVFAKNIWKEDVFFFEADLLLGIQAFVNEDYINAEKHFNRISKISEYDLLLEDLLGKILIVWTKASQNKKEDSFQSINNIPEHFGNLKKIQNSFLHCYFDTSKTQAAFEDLVNSKDTNFSRYNFFLANHLLFKKKKLEAKKRIDSARKIHNSNLLIKQVQNFLANNKSAKIKNFFNCKNSKDILAEIFYVIANLYSSQEDYQMSNFYLKISLFLNNKFVTNKTLLAENLFYEKKYEQSKKIYNSLKLIGSAYSWYASISVSIILSNIGNIENAIFILKQEFDLLKNPNLEHYFELANFYKDSEYYDESIKFYTMALENIEQDHNLIPKILYRRGTSYERLGNWKQSEIDLKKSLKILPDQPEVLNYLAYGWIEKNKNINQTLEMLKKATSIKKNDGYIIDSLGWAYYVSENYIEAEKYLQRAVEILPLDPIINDHYADTLWMLNKDIQARYFWNHVLNLSTTKQELKDTLSKKIIFGINKNL